MKYSRTVCTSLIALTSTTLAFRSSSSTFLGQSTIRQASRVIPYSTTTPTMLLSKLFGGGAFGTERIAYQNLDHPGPELAQWAEQGKMPATSERDPHLALATFAGGCFWGLELAYQRVPGVQYTAVGYAQGPEEFPTYNQVCAGATGHTEAVMVYYDPKECDYSKLLDTFFDRIDPTTVNGQGRDFGKQYRTGIYFHTPEQEAIARARFEEEAKKYKKPMATELKAATPFWPAEKYHQQYLEKGGRFGMPQDASKGATETIRCYG
ncbi:peptide-methionine (S)-S-oxide reductase [Fistulifera solaris]|uniref:peptide-methionine (S)-S-oxide reductase n=1 Tax=Fistulifera solaris TaxID=1519565 RepID=A0A1Z5KFI2_FISSO|nr:peptide-methionine (S)-S-oxide reductase [Fistulifera solaris]|eukprot:GAX25009.1 peptide-methionine (S)-S-oxide reductase [Fistulifera solaris]